MSLIKSVKSREILDSRGNPTVEATVVLESGKIGVAAVPSGASTGSYEAVELRDGGIRMQGKGVLHAVHNINNIINKELKGKNALNQQIIDKIMIDLDGTKNKSKLGANAILSVSIANAKAAANYCNLPFYRYLGGINAVTLPVPMMNILNGGSHASNNIDIQEFMIMPVGFDSFDKGLYAATEVFHKLGKLLKEHNLSTSVGDEGGYAPNLEKDEDAIMYICEAIEQCGYKAGEDFCIALDAAASEWIEEDHYHLKKSGKRMTTDELIDYFLNLCQKYPIISIEDPLGEEDFDGFRKIKDKLESVQIVGDDLFVTSTERLQKGIDNGSGNAILIKFNQVGTLTETIDAVRLAKQNGYNTIISHRSGETEDTSIADLAVALETGQIKTGAPSRTDRVCKYNRLLKINKNLNLAAKYMNRSKNYNAYLKTIYLNR